jgi:uncharacterized protein YbaR (Trm112 family)
VSEKTIEPWLRGILRCPSCKGELTDAAAAEGTPELQCAACSLGYPVDSGIPVLLVDLARRLP